MIAMHIERERPPVKLLTRHTCIKRGVRPGARGGMGGGAEGSGRQGVGWPESRERPGIGRWGGPGGGGEGEAHEARGGGRDTHRAGRGARPRWVAGLGPGLGL